MSCSGELVKKFLEETYSVLSESESFFKKIHIRILQCDEKVRSDKLITSAEELEEYRKHLTLYGNGGTDFRPAFAYVQELQEKGELKDLKGLLYFTDGYGIYPRKKPSYDTAFIFCEEDYEDRDVPPWAIRLILPRQDLEPDNEMREDFRFVWDDGDG
jgi:predicted metal-dependent peptidase